jgi:hypothetical protein
MNINQLIHDITPLYNKYKSSSKLISGTESLEIMWDIGDILNQFIIGHNIAPHKLYREVYGKSEGIENISRNTWITREFQGRCYRIHNIFSSKEKINQLFPTLKSFTLFREAMPFFDNKKYLLKGKNREDLLGLLNSNYSNKYILNEIRRLQKKEIGISNSRNQKLGELASEKDLFVSFYNYIFNLTKSQNFEILEIFENEQLNSQLLNLIATNTNALSADGLKTKEIGENDSKKGSIWSNYLELLQGFINQKNAIKIRRFRRLVPPERIAKLADMLFLIDQKFHKAKDSK